ncbi:hypothetical protein LRC484719_32460 [Mycobacterium riyadhense]
MAVEWAARDAEMRNVPLKLVHVVPPLVTAGGGRSDIEALTGFARARRHRYQDG